MMADQHESPVQRFNASEGIFDVKAAGDYLEPNISEKKPGYLDEADPVSCNDLPEIKSKDESGSLALACNKRVEKPSELDKVKPAGPSWNDPPLVRYDTDCTNTSSGNLKHIKRIGKPGNKNDPKSSASEKDHEGAAFYSLTQVSDEEMKTLVLEIFRDIMSNPQCKEKGMLRDIEKRLNIMEQSWGSLSHDVKQQMYILAHDLNAGLIDKALKIHCNLMVQHVREVKNWMVAVKRLIGMKKELQDSQNVNMIYPDNR